MRDAARPPRALAAIAALAALLVAGCGATGGSPAPASGTSGPASGTPAAVPTTVATSDGPTGDRPGVAPPEATPLANPPEQPASDGTTATISTELGDIQIELFTQSSPVAAENFINLADAGFYEGVVFHRIVPGFVIQGGDPEGTGRGGPGYTIEDEPVVGDYGRGIVAMARSRLPNSQGSQFFIVLSDEARDALDAARTYAIFGRVTSGMDVVDRIAAGRRGGPEGDQAVDPVSMTSVSIQRP